MIDLVEPFILPLQAFLLHALKLRVQILFAGKMFLNAQALKSKV